MNYHKIQIYFFDIHIYLFYLNKINLLNIDLYYYIYYLNLYLNKFYFHIY